MKEPFKFLHPTEKWQVFPLEIQMKTRFIPVDQGGVGGSGGYEPLKSNKHC